MPIPEQAIHTEMERFKRLTQEFRGRVTSKGATVGNSDDERRRIYQILVQINEFLEDRLRES